MGNIEKIIKEYLTERNDYFLNNDVNKQNMSTKSKEVLIDMYNATQEMLSDLDIIKEKEGDVSVGRNLYLDEYLTNVITNLEMLSEDIKFLTEFKDEY